MSEEETVIDTRNQSTLKTAQIISLISTPPLVAVICIGALAYYYGHSTNKFLTWWLYSTLLIVGPAAIFLIYQVIKKKEFDIDVSDRSDRVVPLLFASLGAFLISHLVGERFPLSTLSVASQLVSLVLISLTVITFFWKVSLHTTTVSTLITFLVVSIGWYYSAFYLIVLIIGWARYYQRKHTRNQLVLGALLGVTLTLVVKYLIFRD